MIPSRPGVEALATSVLFILAIHPTRPSVSLDELLDELYVASASIGACAASGMEIRPSSSLVPASFKSVSLSNNAPVLNEK